MDHLCREPLCVNPDHLEPVTQRENLRRAERTKLSPEKAGEMRGVATARPELTQAQVGSLFGVAPSTVGEVLGGQRW